MNNLTLVNELQDNVNDILRLMFIRIHESPVLSRSMAKLPKEDLDKLHLKFSESYFSLKEFSSLLALTVAANDKTSEETK